MAVLVVQGNSCLNNLFEVNSRMLSSNLFLLSLDYRDMNGNIKTINLTLDGNLSIEYGYNTSPKIIFESYRNKISIEEN